VVGKASREGIAWLPPKSSQRSPLDNSARAAIVRGLSLRWYW